MNRSKKFYCKRWRKLEEEDLGAVKLSVKLPGKFHKCKHPKQIIYNYFLLKAAPAVEIFLIMRIVNLRISVSLLRYSKLRELLSVIFLEPSITPGYCGSRNQSDHPACSCKMLVDH